MGGTSAKISACQGPVRRFAEVVLDRRGPCDRHSLSFGPHYDPANLGFGPLVCHNDDVLDPSAAASPATPSTRTPSSRSSPGCSRARWCTPTRRAPPTWWRPDGRRCSRPAPASGTASSRTPGRGAAVSSRRGWCRRRPAACRRTSWARRRRRGPAWSTSSAGPGCRSAPTAPGCWWPGWPRSVGGTARRPGPARLRCDRGGRLAGAALRAGDAVRLTDEPGAPSGAEEPTELLVWSFG